MKILHAAETIQGGVASVIRLLYSGKIEGETVRLLVPRGHLSEVSSVPAVDVSVFSSSRRGVLGLVFFALALLKTILEFRPDVVHLHSSFAGAVGRLLLAPFRLVGGPRVVYCPHAFAFMMSVQPSKVAGYVRIERFLARFCDAIICVSKHEREVALGKGLPSEKLRVIQNGAVDENDGFDAPTDRHTLGQETVALFVGRFDRQKGFDTLLEAMQLLENSPVRLIAVGDSVRGGFRREVRDNVDYRGWLTQGELQQVFQEADVIVMPSRWEGFAMVPLEAMGKGIPVLCSDIPSLTELVKDGVNGRVFSVDSPASLASVLAGVSRAEWKVFGCRALETIRADFTSNRMISSVRKLYCELTKESRE